MILKCAIIDDEPLAISLLESYVNKTPFLELAGKYNSAVNALPALSLFILISERMGWASPSTNILT